ncbi:MAG: hypothetical protein D6763_02695 [Alphaproteobacteria bacterium]|nr:MAG: hypothetical protein D6763_02695 [Alphaproteobacteria bacterium]
MTFRPLAAALLCFLLAGCDTIGWPQLSRAACKADDNCRHICPDGSITDPMFPNCSDPSRSEDRRPTAR